MPSESPITRLDKSSLPAPSSTVSVESILGKLKTVGQARDVLKALIIKIPGLEKDNEQLDEQIKKLEILIEEKRISLERLKEETDYIAMLYHTQKTQDDPILSTKDEES
ncbi:hypothetical protein ADUPG1_013539 [Aduncisulcus paluster]|uniref:Mediator complex subunit 9 n=1 Tax=Aduncisulcus paluster TaxID=2918883 RepID=A0ABQ5K819_9EUKA|nr:hypothetical protein ADUPG1_013539 [Aduncisulcus paluster]